MWGLFDRGAALAFTRHGIVLMLALSAVPAEARKVDWLTFDKQSLLPRGSARPISGWVDFCKRLPAECQSLPHEPTTIRLNEQVWDLITFINTRVNMTITPITDESHWGIPDRWDLAEDGSGDCEDFQLLKRKLLAEKGLPRPAMRMTVVIDGDDLGHAVLVIRTDQGEFVLDNRTSSVLPWHATGYVFVKGEGDDRQSWDWFGGRVSPPSTARR
jgi:predicted transglutaminase-like cysteine proteinase